MIPSEITAPTIAPVSCRSASGAKDGAKMAQRVEKKPLVSPNIKVFRMGAKVEDKFDLNDENIFDYANSSLRSELMDIFLASNCYFGISCGTGSSHVAILNRKPIVDLNANLHHLFTFLDKSILLSKPSF